MLLVFCLLLILLAISVANNSLQCVLACLTLLSWIPY